MKCIVSFLLVVLAGATHAYAEPSAPLWSDPEESVPLYGLVDLCRIGLRSAEPVRISEEEVFIAEREKEKSRAALLPALTAFGQYTRYSEEKSAASSFGSMAIQPESALSWGMRLSQSFSLGGKEVTALKIAKKGIEFRRYDLYAIREEYVLKIAESFYGVLKAKKGVDIAKANVARLEKYRDEANLRLRVGEVSKTAVLRAEGELSGARAELIRAENILSLAKATLARVAGIEGPYDVEETGAEGALAAPAIPDSLESLKQRAFSERADLVSAGIQKSAAEDRIRGARSAYWPALSFEGVFLKRDEEPSSSFFVGESIYGLFRIDVPLFEGGLRQAEVRVSEARKRQAEWLYDDLKKTISVEVDAAYLDLRTQAGILASLEDQLRFARENFDAVSKQFAAGLASSIDVIDANTLLVDSERQLSRAQYDYRIAVLRLKRATGTLLKMVDGMR